MHNLHPGANLLPGAKLHLGVNLHPLCSVHMSINCVHMLLDLLFKLRKPWRDIFTYYLLLTTYYLSLITYYLLLITYYLLLITYHIIYHPYNGGKLQIYIPCNSRSFSSSSSSCSSSIFVVDTWVLLKDHNVVTPVRLKPVASRSRGEHSTTEPLRSRVVI